MSHSRVPNCFYMQHGITPYSPDLGHISEFSLPGEDVQTIDDDVPALPTTRLHHTLYVVLGAVVSKKQPNRVADLWYINP